MSDPSSFKSNLYSGAAEFGRVNSSISLVICSIIGLIFIIVGFFLLYKYYNDSDKHTYEVSAKILSVSSCSNNVNLMGCNIDLSYNYNGKNYTVNNFLYEFNKQTNLNSVIDTTTPIYINPSNPSDISQNSDNSYKVGGIIFIVLGIIVPLFSYLNWWLTRKYKTLAAVEGVQSGINIIRNI